MAPELPFAPGQWRFCGEHRFAVRDADAQPGDVLMPGPDGRCQAPSLGALRCDPHYIPDDDALRSLRLVGDRLRTLEAKSWSDWIAETPLLPALDDALDETPLERAIVAKLGYLEAACQQPRTHLRLDEERLAVARCKRPSVRAPSELAARSEDWERRTLWGVRPRRVLGIVRDELYDIYENRVAVALVNNLDVALQRRMRSVRRVVELLKQRDNYQHVLDDSHNYRRAFRILELWGEALEDRGQLEHAKAVQRRIVALRRRVLALKDTLLYRQIGGHRQVRLQLRMTNVLSHDDVYRRVAELWIAWEDHVRSLNVDPEVRWRQEQDAADGFERFVFLVIVRALDVLGFRPTRAGQAAPVGCHGEWTLEGPAGDIVLRRDRAGISVRSVHADVPLRFISLPSTLEAGVTVGELLGSMRGRSVVLAALPADELRAPVEARMRLRGISDGRRGAPMLVAVAPWDLESVERVARTLRWHTWSALFDRFPLAVDLPSGWFPPSCPLRWIRIGDRVLHVIRPPATHEQAWLELDARIEAATSLIQDAQTKLNACSSRDPRENRKRLHLKQELDHAAKDQNAARQLKEGIGKAVAIVQLLRCCPVCRKTAEVQQFEQTEELFRCQCSDCGAKWGRRLCNGCQKSFAFLDFPGNTPSDQLLEADRHYGADVLALPVRAGVYACPNCARQSDGAELRIAVSRVYT